MQSSVLFIYFPIAISLLSMWGLFWVSKSENKLYMYPLVLVNLGIFIHLIGLLLIGGFTGMGVSMLGTLILFISLALFVALVITQSIKKKTI